jgi:hypothetical protein
MVALAGGYYPWGFNTYVQPNNCYSVDETGVVSVAGTGTLPALTGDLRFLDWVSGTEIFMANGHSLAEYSRRWGLVGAGSNPDQRVGEPPQVGEGGGDFGGHAVTEMNRGVEQVARQTVVNLPRAIEEARAAADVSRPSRFHRGHFRGQHAIRYEGEVVLITSTKRSARAAVKALNGMFVA